MSLILRNVIAKLHGFPSSLLKFSTVASTVSRLTSKEASPVISIERYAVSNKLYRKPREVWLENVDTIKEKKLGLVYLHPDVFGAFPRIDILHQNVRWQRMYRYVCYANTKVRSEVRGGGRKPWPQKGTGRARHGSIRSPLWRGGGIAHGPRSPTPHFYMLPFYTRVAGLTSALSAKLAQDDLHVVNELEVPSDEPAYIERLIEERNWGPSVLFVDNNDIMPRNLTLATDQINHINLMPAYGLNVYSMLKYDTLVLSVSAARLIEEKILYQLNRMNTSDVLKKFQISRQ